MCEHCRMYYIAVLRNDVCIYTYVLGQGLLCIVMPKKRNSLSWECSPNSEWRLDKHPRTERFNVWSIWFSFGRYDFSIYWLIISLDYAESLWIGSYYRNCNTSTLHEMNPPLINDITPLGYKRWSRVLMAADIVQFRTHVALKRPL